MGLHTDAHRPAVSPQQESNSTGTTHLVDIPTELILLILSSVHWSDYYSVCGTSKELQTLANIPGSLSASRYGHLFSIPPRILLTRQTDRPFKIHQLFSCASSREGKPYYRISIPATAESTSSAGTRIIPLATSPFRNDSFSHPECHKTVVSWMHVDAARAVNADDMIDKAEPRAHQLVLHRGALYVNNLIVGTGRRNYDGQGYDSAFTSRYGRDADDDGRDLYPTYITVKDVFDAFDRDHPYLRQRRGGNVTIVGFQHVFHPNAGTRGGSHFEVRWVWIADGR
ncbi:hypothetical protein Dda_2448 [Drechslerella dactyloides]|uniref:F-box domain-containing protein n=1 Tax=Drechslerella dactyloides TaxID=74499 RepID=A0AAD6IZL4_DREDA|nr:hypothetical protein Dda_2448 [Drechslerella dactyloides]